MKKKAKRIAKKKAFTPRKNRGTVPVRHEIIVRVAPQPVEIPSEKDLTEPMHEGKKLTIPRTWMSDKQIMKIVQQTPPKFIYKRKGSDGQVWSYITGNYVERVLNYVFGWLWDFEIVEHGREGNIVWVKGRLTVKDGKGNTITKTQFGRHEIRFKKSHPNEPVDYGNNLKSASTDALKKCASLLGIGSDIYGKGEYREETGVNVDNPPAALPPAKADGPVEEIYCHGAGKTGCPSGSEISAQERDYSVKMFGKPLCRSCQKDAKPLPKN